METQRYSESTNYQATCSSVFHVAEDHGHAFRYSIHPHTDYKQINWTFDGNRQFQSVCASASAEHYEYTFYELPHTGSLCVYV